jgi:hypothetical protein
VVLGQRINSADVRGGDRKAHAAIGLPSPIQLVNADAVVNGFGLVQVTSLSGTHLLHDGLSSRVANSCSALTAISRSATARAFTVSTNSSSTGKARIDSPMAGF